MSFANHNILDIALSLIPSTVVQIRKNLGTKVNKYGQSEASYSEWIEVYGIVQPGSEHNEHTERIDFSKKFVSIWLRGVALDGTHLQWAPDQIRYQKRIYNVIDVEDWFPYDNYRKCECVEAMNLGEDQRGLKHQAQPPFRKTKTPVKPNPFSKKAPAVKNDCGQSVHDLTPQSNEESSPHTQSVQPPVPPHQKKPEIVGKALIRF